MRDDELYRAIIWQTTCGRYRICRIISKILGEHRFVIDKMMTVHDKTPVRPELEYRRIWTPLRYANDGNGQPKSYRHLDVAIGAVLEHFKMRGRLEDDELRCNNDEILEGAIRASLDSFPRAAVAATPGVAVRPRQPTGPRQPSKRQTDAFGATVGSDAALIAACLTGTPKTMGQLKQEAGTGGTVYGFFNKLVKQGLIEKVGNGFKRKG